MAQFRPAGLSDDSDSDDYGFYERPSGSNCPVPQPSLRKKIENNFQDAVINGNLKEIEKIVVSELQNNVNVKFEGGWTPLLHACFHAQEAIVRYLLEKGADPNLHADSVTPLMAVCSNSSANNEVMYCIVSNLLKTNCILNVGDKYGQTPLMRAIGSGRVAVVQKLLNHGANIEMRDQQGWTSVFWAVHHNQPEILEMLIRQGARLMEVDKSGRMPLDIAQSHEYENIIEMLEKHIKPEEEASGVDRNAFLNEQVTSWQDYYPGIKVDKPTYSSEILQLLYGMNCDRLVPVIAGSGIDLRTFLLLDDNDMTELGIDMPFERQRLKLGIRNFHSRPWKLNAVAGLFARKTDNYSVLDCLSTLGTHLQHVYVMEATLQYALREYNKIQNQLKFEPPDSPLITKMNITAKKMLSNVKYIKKEIRNMKNGLTKISRSNPQPADLIREKTLRETALHYVPNVVFIATVGFFVYYAKNLLSNILKR